MDKARFAMGAHMATLLYSINVCLVMIDTAREPRFQLF